MKSIIFLSLISITVLLACERDPLYVDGVAGDLVGTWIDQNYVDTLYTYSRASHIPDDTFGWTFNKDGTLMQRANAGFCGTPPITYADYQGDWTANDSIVDINIEFWGGASIIKWKIIEITETKLILYKVSHETYFAE